jgi:hypothetical protein
VAGRAAEARGNHRGTRPQRPQPGQGDLEARGLLPQRQARRVPVRHSAQRARAHQPRRRDTLHAQVRTFFIATTCKRMRIDTQRWVYKDTESIKRHSNEFDFC